ncbi:hypothetical protein DA2_2182 [Desulfovibrio sp. A2]|nr:hypothetical protein DA2_2182 [Desulfovibrio sp. A2]
MSGWVRWKGGARPGLLGWWSGAQGTADTLLAESVFLSRTALALDFRCSRTKVRSARKSRAALSGSTTRNSLHRPRTSLPQRKTAAGYKEERHCQISRWKFL